MSTDPDTDVVDVVEDGLGYWWGGASSDASTTALPALAPSSPRRAPLVCLASGRPRSGEAIGSDKTVLTALPFGPSDAACAAFDEACSVTRTRMRSEPF